MDGCPRQNPAYRRTKGRASLAGPFLLRGLISGRPYANIRSLMVVAVILPRFSLAIAAGGRAALAEGPLALAPEPGRAALVGEVSPAAEALGVAPGMKIAEALARAPRLRLIAADPVAVADSWERVLVRLESVGAQVEDGGVGLACFEARGLGRLHGGSLDGVVKATRAALKLPARIGAGSSRFCAVVAAEQARSRRPSVVDGAAQLAGAPAALLGRRPAARLRQLPTACDYEPALPQRRHRSAKSRRRSVPAASAPHVWPSRRRLESRREGDQARAPQSRRAPLPRPQPERRPTRAAPAPAPSYRQRRPGRQRSAAAAERAPKPQRSSSPVLRRAPQQPAKPRPPMPRGPAPAPAPAALRPARRGHRQRLRAKSGAV